MAKSTKKEQLNSPEIYFKYYREADKYVVLNKDDSVLRPVILKLPTPPPIEKIDGYGLAPHEQYFRRHELPSKLKILERRVLDKLTNTGKSRPEPPNGYKIVKLYWDILNEEKENFKQEIDYIKRVTYFLRFGYWFFNNGKPTWITPWHYMYLNFWYMDDTNPHYPEYRDRDRRSEVYEWYLYKTNETFADFDDKGFAKRYEGKYRMKNMPSRVFFGSQQPKRRRVGATMQALCKLWWISISIKGSNNTIVSMTGLHAEKAYKKLITAWQRSPMFLKPVWNSNNDPGKRLNFINPPNVYNDEAMGSRIFFTESANETANDSDKLHGLTSDEEGKTAYDDIQDRWRINKKTMHQGQDIHGYSTHPSTVESMNESAAIYERMWNESNFYVRNPEGQTTSGLARMFFKTEDGYDGYIDRWGMSVIDTPTDYQLKYAPPNAKYVSEKKGARQYFEEKRSDMLKKLSDSDYRKEIRKEPQDSTEAFMGDSGDVGFPLQIIDKRISELKYKPETRQGNFVENAQGYVEWVDSPEGRFECSKVLTFQEMQIYQQKNTTKAYNADKLRVMASYEPTHPNHFVCAIDPYDYMVKTEAKLSEDKVRRSQGSGAVFWMKDDVLDFGKEMKDLRSYRFVLTYKNRTPGTETFHKDMLFMARYYGAMVNVERNKGSDLIKYFVNEGYAGFLIRTLTADGKLNTEYGTYTSTSIKDRLFEELNSYLYARGHVEKHLSLLQECKDIKGTEQMTRYDQLTSCGLALIAQKESFLQIKASRGQKRTINMASYGFSKVAY